MPFWDRKKYVEKSPYTTERDCQFCTPLKWDEDLFINSTEYWIILHNKYPYYWVHENLLAFPKRHIAYTYELNNEELLDFKNVEKFMKNYFWEENYFSFIRQWTWWRSVEHIHYHYLKGIFVNIKNKQFNVI